MESNRLQNEERLPRLLSPNHFQTLRIEAFVSIVRLNELPGHNQLLLISGPVLRPNMSLTQQHGIYLLVKLSSSFKDE